MDRRRYPAVVISTKKILFIIFNVDYYHQSLLFSSLTTMVSECCFVGNAKKCICNIVTRSLWIGDRYVQLSWTGVLCNSTTGIV